MGFRVIHPGLLTTVQDLGRFGYQRYGVSPSGMADAFHGRMANLLVGNSESAALLEATLWGPTLEMTSAGFLAVSGADLGMALNGSPLPMNACVPFSAGDQLASAGNCSGCRAYLAFSGGLDVPSVMGSRSTDLKAGFGGFRGRALAAGDEIGFLPAESLSYPALRATRDFPFSDEPLRILPGPQADAFTREGWQALLTGAFRVEEASDRMGCRLSGPEITHKTDANILSAATAPGTIQVPANGQPIVLLPARQTTGGYTQIAQVIWTDLSRAAQARPGDQIRFAMTDEAEALLLYRKQENFLSRLRQNLVMPVRSFRIDTGKSSYTAAVQEIMPWQEDEEMV